MEKTERLIFPKLFGATGQTSSCCYQNVPCICNHTGFISRDSGEEGTLTDVTKYTCCSKIMAPSSPEQRQLHKLWFNSTGMWFNLTETEPFYDIIYVSGMIYPKYDVRWHWLEFIPLCPVFENLIYEPAWSKKSSVNVCVCLFIWMPWHRLIFFCLHCNITHLLVLPV